MPSSELSIPNPLSTTLQNVQDEANASSALLVATNAVQVAPAAPLGTAMPTFVVQAPASTQNAPCVQLNSQSAESAIRFFTATDGAAVHIGLGGNGGAGNLFVFTGQQGIVVKVEQDGDVRIERNLSIGGQLAVGAIDGSQTKLVNVPAATTVLKHLMIDPASGKLFLQ